jgi:signal recognition particle subunit SRP54
LQKRLSEKKRKVLLAAADVYRPAAIEQLKTLGNQINIPVFQLKRRMQLRLL